MARDANWEPREGRALRFFGFQLRLGLACGRNRSRGVPPALSVDLRISGAHCAAMDASTPSGGSPLVIVNPEASRLADPRRRARIVEAVLAAVEARTGRAPVVHDTTADAAADAVDAASDAPLIVVVGGDGTIREAATALAGRSVPLAIVPAGTGNAFAAALGIPRRTEPAIRLIATGRPGPVDLGMATWGPPALDAGGGGGGPAGSKAFVVACGLGFDARVMAGASGELKRRLGFLAYVVVAAREAARIRPVTFRIEADGEVHDVRGLVVLVANSGQLIPGVVGPRHPIDPTDGLLDVIVVTATGVPDGLLGAAESLLAGGAPPHHRPRSMRLQARCVRVTSDPPEPVEVDGDAHEAGWLEARALPAAVTILRP